ncbi:hypothetical protein HPB48_007281 [Haemaphysalis longicornis]|uniref:Calponin-homology (CH) domain-containing protein n=1 Tax=Haemaphysalis longicornis TaxID=44386 RepID=A0A9J6FVS3_HAELO|nr:hypothetical protein HPB48_007281 [Haemaphysalis longicornis]
MISRDQLVAWINERLRSSFTVFEDLSSGEYYCKLLEMLSAGSLPLTKVRDSAKLERDRIRNFELLQHGLETAGLPKTVLIEGLIASRFRESYELVKCDTSSPSSPRINESY